MSRFYSETDVVRAVEGLTVTRLRVLVAAGCVAPAEQHGRLAYAEADVARVRLAADLASDFEIDEDAAAMVIGLIDQIHGLRRQLRSLAEAIAVEDHEVRVRVRDRLGDPGGRPGRSQRR